MINLAIDPGKRGSGVALFETDILGRAGYWPAEGGSGHELAASAYALQSFSEIHAPFGLVVIERPRIYQTAQQRGSQEDISELSIVVGTLLALFTPLAREVRLVYPSEWKGQVSKKITEARVKKTLRPEELNRVQLPSKSLQHNVWDAIGIGLNQIAKRIK